MNKPNKNPNRIEKMNALLQQIVGKAIEPYLENEPGLATVSRAECSRDLKWAKIWVSIIGGNDDKILKIITANIYEIQGQVNRSVDLHSGPRLQFFLDTSPRYAEHINKLIDQLHQTNSNE